MRSIETHFLSYKPKAPAVRNIRLRERLVNDRLLFKCLDNLHHAFYLVCFILGFSRLERAMVLRWAGTC